MRRKLALIFGTPIAITLVLVIIYYSQTQEKLEPIFSPTNEWGTYQHPTEGFMFNYPPGSEVFFDNKNDLTITFKPAGNPVPIMKIFIEEEHDDEYEDLSHMATLSNVEINGLKGRIKVDKYDADEMGPELICTTYRLEHEGMFYSLFTWECLEWEPFENVVKSFRFQ